jgi:hypothetical protein
MMGGDVTVTSETGKGSVFTVRLPDGRHGKPRRRSASTCRRRCSHEVMGQH